MVLDIGWGLNVGVLDLDGALVELLAVGLEVFEVVQYLLHSVLEGLLLLSESKFQF